MDNQQRQKALLAAFAAVALGAGSWFTLMRKPPETSKAAFNEGPVVRKQTREAGTETQARKTRARAVDKRTRSQTLVRRERPEPERRVVERKNRRRDSTRISKKEERSPWG